MTPSQIIAADLTWLSGRFQSGIKIRVNMDGRISEVGPFNDPPTLRLAGHAVVPGMVNAHSHAFQRGLRGKGERFGDTAGNFWSWREDMYRLVETFDHTHFVELCEHSFREMLAGGITAVGEFHYIHHSTGDHDFRFDELILDAAARAGIRITLLNTYYSSGGIKRPLASAQRRFETASLDEYWDQMSRLASSIRTDTQSLGVAAHSIRAVPIETVCLLHDEAHRRKIPFHMHVEEQQLEIDDCVREYGKPPLALLNRETGIRDNLVAVHCTHSRPDDIEEFRAAGGRVCVCPLTEANLGDGIPDAVLFDELTKLSLGTDSNARISMAEEMRWLEYGQRLARETRGAVRDRAGNVAAPLFEIATRGGAAALGLDVGEIRQGAYADLVAIDLMHPSLRYADDETLLPAFVFGSGNEAVSDVAVGGRWINPRDT